MSLFPGQLDSLLILTPNAKGIPPSLIPSLNNAISALEAQLGFSVATAGDTRTDATQIAVGPGRTLCHLAGRYTVPASAAGNYADALLLSTLFPEGKLSQAQPIPASLLTSSLGATPSPLMQTQSPVFLQAIRRVSPTDTVSCGVFPNPHGQAVFSLLVQPDSMALTTGEIFDLHLFLYGGA